MAKMSVTLQVWGNNHAKVTSIQGEAGSRTIEVIFLDASGAPVDLTGCTSRMVVDNGAQEPPMNDGTIADAAGGIADFTITSDMLTRTGDWPCEFALAGPNYPLLKANGLTLHVDASNTENAVGGENKLASLWIALNKADAAAATAQQAAADGRQAVTDAHQVVSDAQAAITSAGVAASAANSAAVKAADAAGAAQQAILDTAEKYRMINPLTGQEDYVTNIIDQLKEFIFSGAITAQEFDNLHLTAQQFDTLMMSARNFDTKAKTLLGVS